MVLFGLYTGQRLGDLARLTWAQIDLQRETVTLRTGKTGKHLVLPLAKPLLDHLKAQPTPIDRALPIHSEAAQLIESQRYKTGHLSNRFGKILEKAGLRSKTTHKGTGKGRSAKRETNGLSFHSLRRTATTLLHEAGVPAAVAQALIGHDSEEIHAIYISVGEKALRDAAAKLPTISIG